MFARSTKQVLVPIALTLQPLGPFLGARAFLVGGENFVAVPTVDINYVYGITHRLDYEARLSTIGAVSLVDTGLRYRIAGDEDLSLAVRANASGLVAFTGTHEGAGAGGLFGLTPGVVLSMGGRNVQFSAGLDVPMMLGAGAASEFGGVRTMDGEQAFGYVFRPFVAAEIPVGRDLHLTAQAQAYVENAADPAVLPALSLGLSW